MEWVATGRVFGAAEALEAGLVRSVHPPDELLGAAHELAREIADHTAPVSVALARRLMWQMLGRRAPDARPPRRLARRCSPAGSRPTRTRA